MSHFSSATLTTAAGGSDRIDLQPFVISLMGRAMVWYTWECRDSLLVCCHL